jgi:hypothetical protein
MARNLKLEEAIRVSGIKKKDFTIFHLDDNIIS